MKNNSFTDSLRHAIDGIMTLLKEERNMRIHFVMTILVVTCAVLFGLSRTETAIVVSLCGAVICAELINTAIENAVNYTAKNSENPIDDNAKIAKDSAAGGVLVLAIGSAIIGLIIFVPKILALI